MKDATRRGFLAISGAGVAAAAVAPSAIAAGRPAAGQPDTSATAAAGPMMAYVHDGGHGQVTLMKGEQQIVIHDPALVRALVRHAQQMGK